MKQLSGLLIFLCLIYSQEYRPKIPIPHNPFKIPPPPEEQKKNETVEDYLESPQVEEYLDRWQQEVLKTKYAALLDDPEFLKEYTNLYPSLFDGTHYSAELSLFLAADFFKNRKTKAVFGKKKKTEYEKNDRLYRKYRSRDRINEKSISTNLAYILGRRVRSQTRQQRLRTDFTNGRPLTILDDTPIPGLVENLLKKIAILRIPYETRYRRDYESELAYKYYLKKYPGGLFTVSALFEIGRLRLKQNDPAGALKVFETMVSAALEKNNMHLMGEELLAKAILQLAKKHRRTLNLIVKLTEDPTADTDVSKLVFISEEKLIKMSLIKGKTNTENRPAISPRARDPF